MASEINTGSHFDQRLQRLQLSDELERALDIEFGKLDKSALSS
jgi:hypothetical protein